MDGFDFWAACHKAISIDSSTSHGNAEYVGFLQELLSQMDLKVRIQPVEADGYRGLNLIGEKGFGPDVILFDTHLDTVSPGDPALWTETSGDPFRATIRSGNIYGLGTADVKLDFICKLKALEGVVGKRFRNRFILLGTFAEETGLLGAKAFLDEYTGQLDFALIGEPTELKLVNRHKGRGCYEFRVPSGERRQFEDVLKIEFRGKAAHSSAPGDGVNAVDAAFRFLSELRTPPTHLSVSGGMVKNIVPESCILSVPRSDEILTATGGRADVRIVHPPDKSSNILLAESAPALAFWAAATSIGRTLSEQTTWVCTQAVLDDAGYYFHIDSRFWEDTDAATEPGLSSLGANVRRTVHKTPSFFETSTAWYVEGLCGALEESGVPVEFISHNASTEAALFGHRCTTLIFGPGHTADNVHQPNEHNSVDALETAIRSYRAILRRLVVAPNL